MKTLILSLLTAASLAAAPQAIVFDFGGVMTKESNRELVIEFLRKSFHTLSDDEFKQANANRKEALKAGKTDEEFWLELAREQGVELDKNWPAALKTTMQSAINANAGTYRLVDDLKQAGFTVGMLSNVDHRLAKLVKEFGLYAPFDPCVLSCEIGKEKPDPETYKILLAKLALPPSDVVFIDDKIQNVEQAKELGIDAILFVSEELLRQEFQKREIL